MTDRVRNYTTAKEPEWKAKKDLSDIKDYLTQEGMNYYFSAVDRNPQNINHINGWYNRRKNYYSDSNEFDKLYLNKKNEYLQKYKNYYTGK